MNDRECSIIQWVLEDIEWSNKTLHSLLHSSSAENVDVGVSKSLCPGLRGLHWSCYKKIYIEVASRSWRRLCGHSHVVWDALANFVLSTVCWSDRKESTVLSSTLANFVLSTVLSSTVADHMFVIVYTLSTCFCLDVFMKTKGKPWCLKSMSFYYEERLF